MKKWVIISILIIVIFFAGNWLFFRNTNTPQHSHYYNVKKMDVKATVSIIGQLVPKTYALVKTSLGGEVEKIYVEQGQHVKAGEAILKIRATPSIIETLKNEYNLRSSILSQAYHQRQYHRYKLLTSKKQATPFEFEQWKLNNDIDLAKVNYYARLDDYYLGKNNPSYNANIVSPLDGTIIKILVRQGDSVEPATNSQAGNPIFIVADMNQIIFRGVVNQLDSNQLKIGFPAAITLPAFPRKILLGGVSFIAHMKNLSSSADKSAFNDQDIFQPEDPFNNGFEVNISGIHLPEDFPERIGYQGTATVTVAHQENVITAPLSYIYFSAKNKAYVYRNRGHKTEKVFVNLGVAGSHYVAIQQGLAVGDVLIKQDID